MKSVSQTLVESQKNNSLIFFKNYFWQFFTFLAKVLSLFWVTPFLSANKEIFGIYSLVVSFSIFLNYADLGFFKAAQQIAAQAYIKKQIEDEIECIGFSGFVSFLVFCFFLIVLLLFSYSPNWIIRTNGSSYLNQIASRLFLISALSLPIIFFQKLLGLIFEIRLQGFKIYKIFLLCNVIPVVFVTYFQSTKGFLIVEYYAFIQLINFLGICIAFYLTKTNLNYSFLNLFRKFYFNRSAFHRMKGLAFSSFYLFFLWFLWNELDRVFVGNYFGATALATYMLCNLFYTSIITVNGILFQPITTKANYIFTMNGLEDLKVYLLNALKMILPIYMMALILILFILKKFILLWIGNSYNDVVMPSLFIIGSFGLLVFSQQIITLLTITNKLRIINIYSTIQVIMFWICFVLVKSFFSINELIISKSLVIVLGHVYMIYINHKLALFDFSESKLYFKVIYAAFLTVIIYYIFDFLERQILISSTIAYSFYYLIAFCISLLLYWMTQKNERTKFQGLIFKN